MDLNTRDRPDVICHGSNKVRVKKAASGPILRSCLFLAYSCRVIDSAELIPDLAIGWGGEERTRRRCLSVLVESKSRHRGQPRFEGKTEGCWGPEMSQRRGGKPARVVHG